MKILNNGSVIVITEDGSRIKRLIKIIIQLTCSEESIENE